MDKFSRIQKKGLIGLFLGFGLLVGMGGVWGAVESTGRKLGGDAFFGEVDRKGIHRVTGNAGAGLLWYVDASASPAGDGMSWGSAFVDLQDGLGAAGAGDAIWVAEGVYVPTGDGDRGVSFEMGSGVALFGGFPAGGGDGTFEARDFDIFETILSGDLNGDDGAEFKNYEENSRHVMTAAGVGGVVLDGLVVSGGNADSDIVAGGKSGGGLQMLESSSITIRNCAFLANRTGQGVLLFTPGYGGAIYSWESDLYLDHCRFMDNRAGIDADYGGGVGGAIFSNSLSLNNILEISHCQFMRNRIGFGAGADHRGGAISAKGTVSISRCHFDGNSAWAGGGISLASVDALVSNCTFLNNFASAPSLLPKSLTFGGALLIGQGRTMVANCIFEENEAVWGGAISIAFADYYSPSGVTIVNCLLRKNRAEAGGGVVTLGSDPLIVNCTIIENEADSGGGIYNPNFVSDEYGGFSVPPSFPLVLGSVIWHNRGGSVVDEGESISSVTRSNIENGFEGSGNINVGPEFIDVGHGDFRLSARSGCIDPSDSFGLPQDLADLDGDGDTEEPIPFDLNGNPRVMGTGPDMGAFEFGGMPAPPTGSVMKFVDTEGQWDADGSGWDRATPALRAALENAGVGDEILVAEGVYRPTVGTDRTASFHLRDGVALFGGFPSGGGSFESRDSERRETILSGDIGVQDDAADNSFHVVVMGEPYEEHAGMVLDGFTIMEGNADGDYPDTGGGGVCVTRTSEVAIHDCFFVNNQAHFGGGLQMVQVRQALIEGCQFYGNGAGTGGGVQNLFTPSVFIDCEFQSNTASGMGGGIYNRSNTQSVENMANFLNCVIQDNTADRGGGMAHLLGDAMLTNCIISGNSARDGGGSWSISRNLFLTNCTISGNNADEGGGMHFIGNFENSLHNCIVWGNTPEQIVSSSVFSIDIHHSNIEGGFIGEGNIDVDPRFVDAGDGDFRLGDGSPCIDAGDMLALPLDVFDLDGDGDYLELIPFDLGWMGRVMGAGVDMGAFEFQGEGDDEDNDHDDHEGDHGEGEDD